MNINTYASELVYALQFFKVLEGFIWLLSIAYFIGNVWFVVLEIYFDAATMRLVPQEEELFILHNNLDILQEKQSIKLNIIMTYFLTTTMTTIGLGDMRPYNNFERITCIILMLFGVSCFTYLHSRVVSTIETINQIRFPHQNDQRVLE